MLGSSSGDHKSTFHSVSLIIHLALQNVRCIFLSASCIARNTDSLEGTRGDRKGLVKVVCGGVVRSWFARVHVPDTRPTCSTFD